MKSCVYLHHDSQAAKDITYILPWLVTKFLKIYIEKCSIAFYTKRKICNSNFLCFHEFLKDSKAYGTVDKRKLGIKKFSEEPIHESVIHMRLVP